MMGPKGFSTIAGIVVIFMLVMSVFFGSWYTIDTTERGVLLTNGAIASDTPIDPGLHFKLPFVQSVDTIYVTFQSGRWEKVSSFSADQQDVSTDISINYHVSPAEVVQVRKEYLTFQNLVDRALSPRVPSIFKNVFGTYTVQTAVQQRAKLNADFLTALQSSLQGVPIVIDSVQIENFQTSPAYTQAIEEKQLADVQVQKLQQQQKQAEVQALITVTNAKAAADAVVATANAESQAIKLKGDAEAGVIQARGQALKDNPGVTSLIQAEKWDGHLPTTMPPNSAVPFLDIGHTAN